MPRNPNHVPNCYLVNKEMCSTCPFRKGVARKYKQVKNVIAISAMTEASRICHQTGKDNLFYDDTGKPERLCRGARDLQLKLFYGMGFIEAPTDEAWAKKRKELGV